MKRRVLKGPRRLGLNNETPQAKRKTGYAVKHNNYKAKHPKLYGRKFTRKPIVKKAKGTTAQKINEAIKELTGNWNNNDYWQNKSEDELVADLLS